MVSVIMLSQYLTISGCKRVMRHREQTTDIQQPFCCCVSEAEHSSGGGPSSCGACGCTAAVEV